MQSPREILSNFRSQTGAATLMQLAVVTFFVVVTAVSDLIKNCDIPSSCVANSFLWIIILFGIGLWFFLLSALGYALEMKRSAFLAKVLIVCELFTAFIAFMIVSNAASIFSGIAAAITLAIALATALMAFRIHQAKGGRVVTIQGDKRRPRRRPRR